MQKEKTIMSKRYQRLQSNMRNPQEYGELKLGPFGQADVPESVKNNPDLMKRIGHAIKTGCLKEV